MVNWQKVWKTFKIKSIPVKWKSCAYKAINDVYTVGEKMNRHQIEGSDKKCKYCRNEDTLVHRIKHCTKSEQVWQWTEEIVKNKLGKNLHSINSIPEIFEIQFSDPENEDFYKWLLCATCFFILETPQTNLEDFKNMIRIQRFRILKCHKLPKIFLSF